MGSASSDTVGQTSQMEKLQESVIPESQDDQTDHNATESDSNVSDYPESLTPIPKLTRHDLANNERKMKKNEMLLASRLTENRHRDDLHNRAKKLKHHYREVEACDKIMAYGFVAIMFL